MTPKLKIFMMDDVKCVYGIYGHRVRFAWSSKEAHCTSWGNLGLQYRQRSDRDDTLGKAFLYGGAVDEMKVFVSSWGERSEVKVLCIQAAD